ncbi:hypothetical protein BHS09_30960 [Myxococcus xanthus]|uniref:Uncharacterized protein n=1 Tax=Myxococcus xanthus TaxID=34 RepID=A0AAE6G505_MYXXA|nr:hypothetical protein BHS09_30960 [Myxococcus xanthus]QDE78321.1 hypothetical protein BHS08_30980 [Myxococcus xanthus]
MYLRSRASTAAEEARCAQVVPPSRLTWTTLNRSGERPGAFTPATAAFLRRRFRAVVVERKPLILDEASEGLPLLAHVGDGLTQRTLGRVPRRLCFEPGM